MSTKTLAINQNKNLYGMTGDGYAVYKASKNNIYEEFTSSASTTSMCPPSDGTTTFTHEPSNLDRYIYDEFNIDLAVINSSATEAPSWPNPYLRFKSVKLVINNIECGYLTCPEEIICAVDAYCREHCENIFQALMRIRNSSAENYTGDQDAVSATTRTSLPMSVLFPLQLCGLAWPRDRAAKIAFEVMFATDYGTAASNGRFVVSNTTSNAYSSNLTYSEMKLRTCVRRVTDDVMYSMPIRKFFKIGYEVKPTTVSTWNTSADKMNIVLKTNFAYHSCCRAITTWGESASLITSYNDSDCVIKFSGPTIFAPKVSWKGKVYFDHSDPTKDLAKRKRYCLDVNHKLFGTYLPMGCLDGSSNLAKYLIHPTRIDLMNIATHDTHETVITGMDQTENLEVEHTCAGSIANAACTIYNALEYIEEVDVDKNGNFRTINTL